VGVEDLEGTTEAEFEALAPLFDPVRRALYLYVAAQAGEVSRDQASEAVGVTRRLAAFHLDKLVDAGFLEASFRRLNARSGPGAGRPSKVYSAVASEHQLSLPPRDYELAADLFAEALAEETDPGRRSVDDVARRRGRRVGADALAGMGHAPSRERRTTALMTALAALGYRPYRVGTDLRLRNCPFDSLAQRHRELVCGMNLCLLRGVVEGMDGQNLEARLDVSSADCCVVIATGPGS
jgi:predicted ArsR family transcriptional regulator